METVNHELNCDDKCLIYLLKYKIWKKQYVEETKDTFWRRWNKGNDRKFQRNEDCMQQHLQEHFYSRGYKRFLGNVSQVWLTKLIIFNLGKGKITEWEPERPYPYQESWKCCVHFICWIHVFYWYFGLDCFWN